jgi:hypothetical protein
LLDRQSGTASGMLEMSDGAGNASARERSEGAGRRMNRVVKAREALADEVCCLLCPLSMPS